MEQQTLRIGHNRLPPPFLTREQSWPKRVREGGFEHPADVLHLRAAEQWSGANPAGIMPWASRLHDRASRAAGAREVQKIEPGGAYTTDLNADRLNIEVDRAGVVTGLRCG
jgi:hypothetical protein